ncbi:DUF3823 domain-containing protein [Algoriphagus terrigena]|uniref:DUF3823 domain-containing protein n=1 Tax=Algoriphagus terrigena TaxID=344884 RepID=UPI0003F55E34|nr:DUF3823 domain-containing protein [Algoriphagus terrigena]
MKEILKNIAGVIGLGVILTSCSYDNYEEPKLTLEGTLVYQGEPIGVSYNDVYMELWEQGWQRLGSISVAVDQDGTFSSQLFAGEYKLIIPGNQGPFRKIANPESGNDTIPINLSGSQLMEIEVLPYYMIRSLNISGGSDKVEAAFSLEKIITDVNAKDIQEVFLYVSKTSFVDGRTSIANTRIGGSDLTDLSNISLSVNVPARVPTQDYAFARIGVRIQGVEDMIFSDIVKVDL